MKHRKFTGSRYEMGYAHGAILKKEGERILEQVPFPLSEAHRRFAKQCIPAYQQHFPQVLEELRGLADGQECEFETLCGLLLSMYCLVPGVQCSQFAVRSGGRVLFGRNSDFLTELEEKNQNVLYYFIDGAYSFVADTTFPLQMEDGVNEYGLAAGLTSVCPLSISPGLNAGMLVRLILERCRTVPEAVRLLQGLPIASSQTIVLADRRGNIALVESGSGRICVEEPKEETAFVCATNQFRIKEMRPYEGKTQDNWFAQKRYETLRRDLMRRKVNFTLEDGYALLRGERGFLCQYDRSGGRDTVWSVLYDAETGTLYRAEGNPSRTAFEKEKRFLIHK